MKSLVLKEVNLIQAFKSKPFKKLFSFHNHTHTHKHTHTTAFMCEAFVNTVFKNATHFTLHKGTVPLEQNFVKFWRNVLAVICQTHSEHAGHYIVIQGIRVQT